MYHCFEKIQANIFSGRKNGSTAWDQFEELLAYHPFYGCNLNWQLFLIIQANCRITAVVAILIVFVGRSIQCVVWQYVYEVQLCFKLKVMYVSANQDSGFYCNNVRFKSQILSQIILNMWYGITIGDR